MSFKKKEKKKRDQNTLLHMCPNYVISKKRKKNRDQNTRIRGIEHLFTKQIKYSCTK